MQVLKTPRYKNAAKRASAKVRDPLVSPRLKFLYYMERAAVRGALDHLHPGGAASLAWYQYFMLDIALFLTVCMLSVGCAVYFCMVQIVKFIRSPSRKHKFE